MPKTMKNQDDCRKIIEKYADTVYKLAFSKTGSKYDSDEIFQEVFLRYIKRNQFLMMMNTAKLGL
jgi:Sigma-70 region 2.